MEFSVNDIRGRLCTMPMVAVALPYIAGIVFSSRFEVPSALWLAAIAVAMTVAIIAFKNGRAGVGAAVGIALFSLGALRMNLDTTPEPPYGKPLDMILRFDEPTVHCGGYTRTSARLAGCDGFDPCRSAVRLTVYGDSATIFSRGDEIALRGIIRPFSRNDDRFADMAFRRGLVGSVYMRRDAVSDFRPAAGSGLHDRAVAKLCRLLPADDARRTILSMAAGERRGVGAELRRIYSRGGAAHLLAVSGLHVGIVFMLVNVLLRFVPLVRGGNILRNIVAIAAIWLYVAVCGYPPSAVRAAAMFTMLQLSFFSSRAYSGANALAATATAMLLIAPKLVFDVGFRLSFIAVAAILMWGVPLCRRIRTRYRPLNALSSTLIVGAVSTVAVMPSVSETFGVVPLIGIPLNPAVVVSADAIVLLSVASLLVPMPAAAFVVKPAYWCAWLQNEAVALAASVPWGCLDYRMPDIAAAAVYAVFVAATLVSWGFRGGRNDNVG